MRLTHWLAGLARKQPLSRRFTRRKWHGDLRPAVERLEKLFSSFGLRERIVEVGQESIEEFSGDATYDLVIAEGFVNTLEHRDQMLSKMCRLTAPGGLAVVSFDECVGYTLELVRKLIFWRAYRLEGLNDVRSAESLALAERIFSEDFSQLNASRAFVGWYDDVLVNPFVASDYLWSYQEMLPLIEQEGCEFHATSPTWASVDRFAWYKNVLDSKDRHQKILTEWPEAFSFFLTGLPGDLGQTSPPTEEVVDSVTDLNNRVSNYFLDPDGDVSSVFYPGALDDYLSQSADPRVRLFNEEWKGVHLAASSNAAADVIEAYQSTNSLRRTWGMPYHYLSIRNLK